MVMRVLSAKGKDGFITGEVPRPADPIVASQWKMIDNMVLGWLLNSISPSITVAFGLRNTSFELWELQLKDSDAERQFCSSAHRPAASDGAAKFLRQFFLNTDDSKIHLPTPQYPTKTPRSPGL
ncbi:uncharacterized protein LOC127251068 isoform X2 [Andrographis paniculata]|uniref:uncharacterized protein LOC127251068 isoform X2 n=1 Tax=Andrographis paniculata TaxID=175694 RepID=UPI0021E77B44|nr:uncharacterized protein LOC127251068 isoform X2 [Andrographis paniculata]